MNPCSPSPTEPLLAVPNVSEGRDRASIEAIAAAFAADGGARLLDVHADPDHDRTVLSLAGAPGRLAAALVRGAAEAVRRIDVGGGGSEGGGGSSGGEAAGPGESDRGASGSGGKESGTDGPRAWAGQHPHVGALDVLPVVYLDPALRGAACAEALVAAHEIGTRLEVPVFLYGELASGRTRAELRRGGVAGLARRMRRGELHPDFGPGLPHASAGATLVAARGPLVAFNLELAPPADMREARRIASLIREGGAEGLPGLRAIGIALRRGALRGGEGVPGEAPDAREGAHDERVRAQVSMNVERPAELSLAEVVAAVRRHARLARAELVGLAPRVALEGFPADLPLPGFDPARHVIENALGL